MEPDDLISGEISFDKLLSTAENTPPHFDPHIPSSTSDDKIPLFQGQHESPSLAASIPIDPPTAQTFFVCDRSAGLGPDRKLSSLHVLHQHIESLITNQLSFDEITNLLSSTGFESFGIRLSKSQLLI